MVPRALGVLDAAEPQKLPTILVAVVTCEEWEQTADQVTRVFGVLAERQNGRGNEWNEWQRCSG